MKTEKLIKMANDISNYFNADPDKVVAAEGMKSQILHTWEPRMRKALLEYAQTDGTALSVLARDALARIQAELK